MPLTRLIPAALLFIAPTPATAQGKRAIVVDFGFVNASGNTSVTTTNFRDKYTMRSADSAFLFTQTAGLVYGKTNGTLSAESYAAQLRGDYNLGRTIYLFALGGWDRNTFGGIDHRTEETAGLGIKAITNARNVLALEAGLSLFQQKNTSAPAGESLEDDFKAGRVGAAYKHLFTPSTILTYTLEFIPNFDVSQAWRFNSETAIVAPISTHLGLKMSYLVRVNNLPPFATDTSTTRLKKSDRFLTMGVTIAF